MKLGLTGVMCAGHIYLQPVEMCVYINTHRETEADKDKEIERGIKARRLLGSPRKDVSVAEKWRGLQSRCPRDHFQAQ